MKKILVILLSLCCAASASVYDADSDYERDLEYRSLEEDGGRFRAGAMADFLTPESEAIRDNSFNGYYDSDGETSTENGMEELISPDSEDIEELREEWD